MTNDPVIIEAMKSLNTEQLTYLKSLTCNKNSNVNDKEFIDLIKNNPFNKIKICPHCNHSKIIRYGINRSNKQKYKCKNCFKVFCNMTNSPMSYSKKSVTQWIQYLKCMCKGYSLRKTADIVKIHRNTAFHWRHKILSAIKFIIPENLEGKVEIDEVKIRESFKGNHSKNKDFIMNREVFKRGAYNYTNFFTKKVTIMCCKDSKGNLFLKTASTGKSSFKVINFLLKDKIAKGSILLTNANFGFNSFAKFQNLKIYTSNGRFKSENNAYSNINAKLLGLEFKSFLKIFKGVSTKYMNHYLTWFKWFKVTTTKNPIYKIVDFFFLLYSAEKELRVEDFRKVHSLVNI
ncbi:IS1595 family transposase [Clostridium amazonitimonense]|uniref:IS1595 family transposase n=1 Tax=Clostridium amazonitimonense TaxID=1499689 RepID=UPI0005097F72|nr:IS1595 family transposase [Clostridium amazonitimonense]